MTLDELRLAVAKAKGWKDYGFGWWLEPGAPFQTHGLPDWPRDISAAWELVEEMHDRLVQVRLSNKGVSMWWCYADIEITAQGSTAPEAICRAYLKWKEHGNG